MQELIKTLESKHGKPEYDTEEDLVDDDPDEEEQNLEPVLENEQENKFLFHQIDVKLPNGSIPKKYEVVNQQSGMKRQFR